MGGTPSKEDTVPTIRADARNPDDETRDIFEKNKRIVLNSDNVEVIYMHKDRRDTGQPVLSHPFMRNRGAMGNIFWFSRNMDQGPRLNNLEPSYTSDPTRFDFNLKTMPNMVTSLRKDVDDPTKIMVMYFSTESYF